MTDGWQAYITSLTQCPAIKRCAIIGNDNGSVWARTEAPNEFRATEAELTKFKDLFNDLSKVPAVGADLEGIHYIVPRTEEDLIFGKKDKTGFFAMKTKSTIIIAVYEGEGVAGTEARAVVEKIAEYLGSNGF